MFAMRLRDLLRFLLPVGLFATAATGQVTPIPVTSVGGPPFIEVWVDACNGNDAAAQVGCSDRPFQTIGAAINSLLGFASPANPGLVHINPGIYSQATNGEVFPIIMRDNIHLQGTGARQCVIRGHNLSEQPQNINVFLPQSSVCVCGTYAAREVLVDVSRLFDPTEEEMIDGLTFQGGDIQVYSRNEAYTRARISNCVFDMLNMDPTHNADATLRTPGPTFGILLVHDYHPGVPYFDDPLNILNNTFIQGWVITDDDLPVVSRRDAVAICDVNNPLCDLPPGQSDPDRRLRGVGNPNIQNNLIRHVSGQIVTALLGIDSSDVNVVFGSRLGPSNAFNPRAIGGRDVSGTYCSLILGSNPTPRVNTEPAIPGGRDPAFVGEMLTRSFAQPVGVSRDWRLLPPSACADQGSSPLLGFLQAANGTTYVEPTLVPLSSFDLDGEVYGNPRLNGGDVDIGFDETDLLVDCAGWANDSVSHRAAACRLACSPAEGQPLRGLIFPSAGAFALFETRVPLGFSTVFPCGGFYPAYTTMPGTIVPPLTIGGFPAPNDLLWMQPGLLTAGPVGNALAFTYSAPSDLTLLTFGVAAVGVNTGPCMYLNEQAVFLPAGATTNLLSNLQSSTE